MASVRGVLKFDSIDEVLVTYKCDGVTIVYDGTKARGAATAMLDKAVSLSADGTVQLAADGEAIVGKLELVESDSFCSVRTGGYTKLPGGDGATLTRGTKIVGALGVSSARGYIRSVNTAVAAELGRMRGQLISVGTPSECVVNLSA